MKHIVQAPREAVLCGIQHLDLLADKRRTQGMPTFAEAAVTVIEQKRGGWRSPRQAAD